MEVKQNTFKKNMKTLVALTIAWLLISMLFFGLSNFGVVSTEVAATIFACGMCLFPLRKITGMILPWLIEYLCSINNYLNQRLEKFMVTKDMNPYSGKPAYKNAGIERIFQFGIWIFWIVIAAIASFLAPVTESRVDILFHELSMFIPRITGNGTERLGFVLYLVLTIGFVFAIWNLLRQMYDNTIQCMQNKPVKYNIKQTAWIVAIYIIVKHVLFDYIFFAYTAKMIWQDILFWGVLVGIVFLGIKVFLWISEAKNNSNANP